MLRQMRHFSQTWFIKFLLLFLVASFAIWGIGDIFRGNPAQRPVAEVGKVKITTYELETQFQRDVQRFRQVAGPEFTAVEAKKAGMMEQSLQNLVQETLFNQETARLGLNMSQQAAFAAIKATPGLIGKDGHFNTALYQTMLQRAQVSEAAYVAGIRGETTRQILVEAIRGGIEAPASLAKVLAEARGQQRVVRALAIDNASMGNMGIPDDVTLAQFHEASAAQFTAPEYRDLSILRLMIDDIAAEIAVSEDDIKQTYEDRRADFSKPTLRSYTQVVLQDEAKAKLLAEDARASHDLKQAAKKHGTESVVINDAKDDDLLPDLKGAVEKIAANEISMPLKSNFGWHVIQMTKIKPGSTQSLAEVKDTIRKMASHDKALEQLQTLANKVDDAIAGGADFKTLAQEMKLRLVTVEKLGQNGTTPSTLPKDLPPMQEIAKYAYSLDEGEASSMLDDGKGNYYVIHADKVSPSHLRPLTEVKDAVLKAWQAAEQGKKARAKADEIAAAVRSGKTLDTFVGTGITMQNPKPVSVLNAKNADLPRSAIPQILAMKKGDVGVVDDGAQYLVIQLAELRPAGDISESDRKAVANDAQRGLINDVFIQYLEQLRQRHPVSMHTDVIAMLHGQGD